MEHRDELTLQEVADELGVHYMTAYRYVRIGMLPAHKQGRSWRVSRADLAAMRAMPRPTREDGQAPWAERLSLRLVAGDEAGGWRIIEAALTGGMSPQDVLIEVVAAAMRRVGDRWADGSLGVDEEHAATAICTRLVGRLGARFARRGVSRGTVVLGTTEHDLHGLPTAIAAEVLRLAGFDVLNLGALVPPASFARAVARVPQPIAVGVTATTPGREADIGDTIRAVRAASGVPVFLGGAAVTSREIAQELGADDWAPTAAKLTELALAVRS